MKPVKVTLIEGDGIGKEVSHSARRVLEATGFPLSFEVFEAGKGTLERTGELIPAALIDSLKRTRLALKGPLTTPVGEGFASVNVALRRQFDLYANIRPIRNPEGTIDLVVFRENTEGLYGGGERILSPDRVEAVKLVTRQASKRILVKAFEAAEARGGSKVTVVHKANILKASDGLFLRIARETAAEYGLPLEEMIVDNMAMQMVMRPGDFGVIVTMNLYGDILSDLGAGLVGGLGLIPSGNIGDEMAIFEAVHGSAPDIAGQGIANPVAMVRSGALLLRHVKAFEAAKALEEAVDRVLRDRRVRTPDLGGDSTTLAMEKAIIEAMKEGLNSEEPSISESVDGACGNDQPDQSGVL